MSRHRRLESAAASAEKSDRHDHVVREAGDRRVYLTPRETVAYLGLSSLNALKQRMKRGTIPAWTWTRMGGKSLRFLRASLDEWLRPAEQTAALRLVHGERVAPTSPSRTRNTVAVKPVALKSVEGGDR